MNIRDHIEAGHYPTDSKGRALVPHYSGRTFVCAATDQPGEWPLVGWLLHEDSEHAAKSGACFSADGSLLLPPQPRKVEVKRWMVINERGNTCGYYDDRARVELLSGCSVIELTGSYEEPWS